MTLNSSTTNYWGTIMSLSQLPTNQMSVAHNAILGSVMLPTVTPDNWRELDRELAHRITAFVLSTLEEQGLLDEVAGWECYIQAPYPWMRTGTSYSVWFTGPRETIIVENVQLADGWPIAAGKVRREPFPH